MQPRRITTQLCDSPCGKLFLASHGNTLCLCQWQSCIHLPRMAARLQRTLKLPLEPGESPALQQARAELEAYFSGRLRHFHTELHFCGSAFQKSVWQQLLPKPHGDTRTSGELARQLGNPAATRAVASAMGANPLTIFAPCHRVTGSKGALIGYAGGLATKQYLLQHEGALLF